MHNYRRFILNLIFAIFTFGLISPTFASVTNSDHSQCLDSRIELIIEISNVSENVMTQFKSTDDESPRTQDQHNQDTDCHFCIHSLCNTFFHSRENTVFTNYDDTLDVLHFSKSNQMISQIDPLQIFQPPKA